MQSHFTKWRWESIWNQATTFFANKFSMNESIILMHIKLCNFLSGKIQMFEVSKIKSVFHNIHGFLWFLKTGPFEPLLLRKEFLNFSFQTDYSNSGYIDLSLMLSRRFVNDPKQLSKYHQFLIIFILHACFRCAVRQRELE